MKLPIRTLGVRHAVLPLGILALVPAARALAYQEAAPPAAPQGGLQRVDPRTEAEEAEPRGLAQAFQREFRRDDWLARLREPDLDRREKSLDALLKRARLDPAARAFLEDLARDPAAGEAAWTARLALRELGRVTFPLQGLNGLFPGNDPLAMSRRMEQMLDALRSQNGMGFVFPPMQIAPGQPSGRSSARRIHVEQGPQGARVDVTELVDGQETTRHYEGPSLEDIFRDNEELARELGGGFQVRSAPGTPLDLRFDLGGSGHKLQRGEPDLLPQGLSRPRITDRLGVYVRDLHDSPEEANEAGLVVDRTYPETYAQLLGVRAGSVLLQLNDRSLREIADIEEVMHARSADDPLTVVWIDELGQRQEKTWQPPPSRK